MTRTRWLTRLLAFLVLLALVLYAKVFTLLIVEPVSLGAGVALVYGALSLVSIGGLLRRRVWGFYSLYALVVFATVMLSVAFIPLPLEFVPPQERRIGLTVLNGVVFVLGVLGHYWARYDARVVPGGAA